MPTTVVELPTVAHRADSVHVVDSDHSHSYSYLYRLNQDVRRTATVTLDWSSLSTDSQTEDPRGAQNALTRERRQLEDERDAFEEFLERGASETKID